MFDIATLQILNFTVRKRGKMLDYDVADVAFFLSWGDVISCLPWQHSSVHCLAMDKLACGGVLKTAEGKRLKTAFMFSQEFMCYKSVVKLIIC